MSDPKLRVDSSQAKLTKEERFREVIFNVDSVDPIRKERIEEASVSATQFVSCPDTKMDRSVTALKSSDDGTTALFWATIPTKAAPTQSSPSKLQETAQPTKILAANFFKRPEQFSREGPPLSPRKKVSKGAKTVGATDTSAAAQKTFHPRPMPYRSSNE